MTHLDPAAFARLIADYCLEVVPGDEVLIRSTTLARDAVLELHNAILDRDAWPLVKLELEGQQRAYFEHAQDRHLDLYPKLATEEARRFDKTVTIQAPHALGALAGIDPEKIRRVAVARAPLRDYLASKRWCSTLWPTPAIAQRAGMTAEELEDFVARALFLDRPDPVAAWRELHDFQDELIARIRRAEEIRVQSAGTDLRMSVRKRRWINSDGRRNMPSGEIFTGPVEDSVNGTITFDVPSSPPGLEIAGVRLVFEDGVVVQSSAERGEEHLRRMLATDAGASRVGELGIGTNFGIDRPIGAILYDEKIGGTIHLALGRSYEETGGANRSAIHWDLICDLRPGGLLTADGEVIQRDGVFSA